MKLVKFAIVASLSFTGATSTFAQQPASATLGTKYFSAGAGILKFGDDLSKEIFGEAFGIEAGYNYPVNPAFDVNLGAAYLVADGNFLGAEIDQRAVGFGLTGVLSFSPGEQFNPFASVGVAVRNNEIEVSLLSSTLESSDETEFGYSGGAGLECVINDSLSAIVGLEYSEWDEDSQASASNGSTDLNFSVSSLLTQAVVARISTSYDTDDGDVSVTVGALFKL